MIIRDILNLKGNVIHSIAPQGLVSDAVATMVKHDIGSLVVMQDGAITGMLTFREVLSALDARRGNLGDIPVREMMVREPMTCALEDSADSLRERMTQHHVRYVPVKQGDRLLGVISFHDIAKAVIKQSNFENRLLKRYIKHWPEDDG